MPNTGYFSDPTAYNSTFTGESGEIYTLTWTATNAAPCNNNQATMTVTIPECSTVIFDGNDDNISFADNFALDSGAFSIEAWIKVDNVTGTQTIISKRDSNNLNSDGYDLSLISNRLYFRWDGSEMFATQTINNTKWYHVAVTFNGTNIYTMYIDGFVVQTNSSGNSPNANSNNRALIGAMNTSNNAPVNYFSGGIDEVRIWNTALTQTQIREMMNQEIEENAPNVSGVVVPLNISGGLQWANLIGYYQMNIGSATNFVSGSIQDISTTSPTPGKLNQMISTQDETAPIPYVSIANNLWDNPITWTNPSVQQIPNSTSNSISGLAQTWNIVRTASNVTSGNRATTVLGLLVDSNTYSIAYDQRLDVNKYLKIEGVLDLEGESQLLQPTGSIVDYAGTGALHRDQQGTSNFYNYNYWSSPVGADGLIYQIGNVLYDGASPVAWTGAHNAIGSTSPVTMSSRWLYLYENYPYDSYYDWHRISPTYDVNVGLGFTMKGSGSASSQQNYTFVGQPNNGTILRNIGAGNEALLGNPYPSAIDANAVINNNNGVLLDGTIRYWEMAPSNNTHITAQYQGGYAYYTLAGGVAAVSPPEINGSGDAIKIPQRYIPVSQGFMVTANATGGNFEFNNSQRAFVTEASGNSIFMRSTVSENRDLEMDSTESILQLIRLDFTTPETAVRHLLLGFTPDNVATEGIDYGYDAINTEVFPSDMSFSIEGEKFIIQGVGAFDIENMYPVIIDLESGGNIKIELTDLENFDEDIDVFVYDALLGTYTRINDVAYQINLDAGSHENRYFIAFQEEGILSVDDIVLNDIIVNYLSNSNEIYIKIPYNLEIKQVYLMNMLGQSIKSWNRTNTALSQETKIPVRNIAEGNYIIKVRTSDNRTVNKKIVIKQ